MDQASRDAVDNFEATVKEQQAQQVAVIADAETTLAAALAAASTPVLIVVPEPVPTGLTPSKNVIVIRDGS
jgi:hypothetical protein